MITFVNAGLYRHQKLEFTNLTIKDDKIIAIGSQELGKLIFLPNDFIITPGFIDLHAHFREPGQTEKEDLITGSEAALYGGYQTVCLMANTSPTIDNLEILKPLLVKAKEAPINLKFFAAISKKLEGQEQTDWESLKDFVVGFSDDGNYLDNQSLLKKILKYGQENKKLVSLHVDNRKQISPSTKILNQKVAAKFNLLGVNETYESDPLNWDLKLAEIDKNPYHLCHISSAKSVELLQKAKIKNPNLTAEVTPHHLVLSLENIKNNDANFMMNPPLNSEQDRSSLVQALNDGLIKVIATDHAPHEVKTKTDFATGTMGIIGLELAFPLLYTRLVKTNQVRLNTILEALTFGPAELINHPAIALEVGNSATFTIIDLGTTAKVEKLHSKSHNTPFLGETLHGWPWANVQKGKIHFLKGEPKMIEKIQETTTLISNECLAPNLWLATFKAPQISQIAHPGQYMNIWPANHFEHPRPFSFFGINPKNETIQAYYHCRGEGTNYMTKNWKIGDQIQIEGPCGDGFHYGKNKKTLIVGAGVGLAPMKTLIEALQRHQQDFDVLIGARSESFLKILEVFPQNVEYQIVTDDGSKGEQKNIVEALSDYLQTTKVDSIIACGPDIVLKEIELLGIEHQISVQSSYTCPENCPLNYCYKCQTQETFKMNQRRI